MQRATVVWDDAWCNNENMISEDEIPDLLHALRVESTGWLLADTKGFVMLATDRQGERFRHYHIVPRKCVVRVEYLGRKHAKPRKR